jgi:3-oxoacyl-[acyl-carrier-protein] synthase II
VSGNNPICYALDMIRQGRDDIMIVGGCDELIDVIGAGFSHCDASSGQRSGASIFDRDIDSMRLGEGAAALVLESEESARARGARILAEVLDYGMANGVGDIVDAFPSDAEGFAFAMNQALELSNATPAQVGYVASAANGLREITVAENDALEQVFAGAGQPLISSARALLGETLGAASTFAAIGAVEVLQRGQVHATFELQPGVLPPQHVAGYAREAAVDLLLVNAVELAGNITSLVLARAPEQGIYA